MSKEEKVEEKVEQESKIEEELHRLKTDVFPNVEDGSLLIVTIGSDSVPATKSDMDRVAETINEIFEGINGVRVLVVPHLVNIERLSLPALRSLQSKVVNSWNTEEDEAVIDLDGFGILGGIGG